MRIAITGSSGFIGSNLTEACLKKGWDVLGIDNFSTGFKEMSRPERFSNLPGKYSFREADINDTVLLSNVMKGCEVVFHLAALPRVSYSIDSPLEANHANITGTLSVLEASRRAGVKRVVFSCSSSIFGGCDVFPTPETTRPAPMSPYALHKQAGAEYCRLYSELHGLETASLIYYNVFGPLQRAGGSYSTIIPAFFEAAINEGLCRIDGNGMQSRDFCYVSNVVDANILAAEHEGKLSGDMFNIACGETHSVWKVFDTINSFYDGKIKSHKAPVRLGDPRKSLADISKAVRVLGYNPRVNFFEGMRLTHEWWKSGCKV